MQDKQSVIGMVLIGLLLMGWLWYSSVTIKPTPHKTSADSTAFAADSAKAQALAQQAQQAQAQAAIPDSVRLNERFGATFSPFVNGRDYDDTIHTSLYTAVVSSHGGSLKKFELTKYNTWNGFPVQIIGDTGGTEINAIFQSVDGKLISTKDLYFSLNAPTSGNLAETDSTVITATLRLDSSRSIVKRLTFHGGSYVVGVDYAFINCQNVIGNYNYQISWDNGMPFDEKNSIDECNAAQASTYQNGALEDLDASKPGQMYKKTPSGSTNWVAERNKYFAVALIAPNPADGAYLEGQRIPLPDNGAREQYDIALQFPFHKTAVEHARVNVFMGPLDYDIVKSLDVGLDNIMSLGWPYVIRPIAVYFMIPIFKFLHLFIANFGLVIIVFSIAITMLAYPFTIKQMHSTRKMQLMAPLLADLKEKHKDDQIKFQSAQLRMYQDYGINPLGGCLTQLPQMPILFAMYAVLRNAIQLRQQPFAGWITDLSVPDIALKLPFTIPVIGLNYLSGLALLMGAATFIQQKMTIKDPRQQATIYMMPIFLTLIFASLPSGLNLYYFFSNLTRIFQQLLYNKTHSNIQLTPVVKKTGKGGVAGATGGKLSFTQRLLEAQQQMQDNKNGGGKKKKR